MTATKEQIERIVTLANEGPPDAYNDAVILYGGDLARIALAAMEWRDSHGKYIFGDTTMIDAILAGKGPSDV